MRKIYFYIGVLAAILFNSCSNEQEFGNDTSDVAKLSIEAQWPTTRASISSYFLTDGDSVGIVLSGYNNAYQNVPSVAESFSLRLVNDVILTSEHTKVMAFYPYQRDSLKQVFGLDASTQTNYLYGVSEDDVYNRNPMAQVTFKHIMARVRFDITYKTGVSIEKMQFVGEGIYKKANFNLATASISDLSSPAKDEDTLNIPSQSLYGSYYSAQKSINVLFIPSEMGSAKLHLRYSNGREFDIDITLPEMKQGSYYTYPITIREDPYNSKKYVDLGLSVKWAECNLGAENPEDAGNYYAWGEVATKTDYSYATYQWGNGSATVADFDNPHFYTKYNTIAAFGHEGFVDKDTVLVKNDDAAYVAYRGYWRIPTPEEVQELVDKCKWTWTEKGGKYGFLVESKVNDNSIFLPAAGTMVGNVLYAYGTYGLYSTSHLNSTIPHYAYELSFYNTDWGMAFGIGNGMRHYGRSIRPVAP